MRVLAEAENMVATEASQADANTVLELKNTVAPCMASLLFVQNSSSVSQLVPQEDTAAYLAEKVRFHLEGDEIWAQKASMLFLLAVNYKI